jgi:hypothetical protein
VDLLEGEVALLVQFFPVKAVTAFFVADGGNKEHDGVQAFGFEELPRQVLDLFQSGHRSGSSFIRFG